MIPSDPKIFEAIVEHIPLMIFVKDAARLQFVLFNRGGEELLGFRREDLHGKSDHDFFPKEQADFFTARDREVLHGKQPVTVEEPIESKNGARHLLTKKVPILDSDGEPLYLLGLSLDITDRKLAEQARDEKSAALAEALRQSIELEPKALFAARASEIGALMQEILSAPLTDAAVATLKALASELRAG